jgi:putative transcriptional regulator
MSAGQTKTRASSGHRVADARRRAGPNQQQLAEKIGAGRVTISRIEKGTQTPTLDVALALARELGEPVETLFEGRGA